MSSLFGNFFANWDRYRKSIEDPGYRDYENMWAMAIDLGSCIGCNACSTACYAENNLATVGEDRFLARQSMGWMRVERYWDEPSLGASDPDSQERGGSFLPMMCQQCNAAPCEPVCPVGATYNNEGGLNAQIYNRCIGSRYCANNCPYRVRYFNFYSYDKDAWPAPLNRQLNPDISVRDKGVMEKCTFCIQRIRAAKDDAAREGRALRDGDVTTACQQTCPTQAIVFGDLQDPESRVRKAWDAHQVRLGTTEQKKTNPALRGYRVFEELNTESCVIYLERVRDTDV
ncbi:4Fe-4S dicluster domain-containing protein [Varunaivibrio sulfuroxidans]|uniref:Molybdopterin-containing oxidoreductase family iron-sulfur binding subunit n=1 Tax=Varunaivibrio sulfuroxidans TaxID=1773489 RepID=A0A4R3J6G7_9PROT|nr:4Fe-4S dicluster domain-containing protein [Varunaivibrio sulfuroxidans]TCS60925.1 molybdopterin-containing oxidoreductase family iron-sulfur binding subunit [Varunaivibrio sulfuroxidans]WES31667.1 4Fe-4S dicluster domain-containing protein [Varunaivibrio sulfuroxidans]